MKVLLLGEFSSLHKYLKEGLEKNGVEVKLIANGDGWKNIKGADDSLFELKGSFFRRKFGLYIEPYIKAKSYKGYDVVQVINPHVYSSVINANLLKKIKKNNAIFSLVAAGVDYKYLEAYSKKKFVHCPLDYDKEARDFYDNSYRGRLNIKNANEVEEISEVIIPSLYEYKVGYLESKKIAPVIPFPINVDEIEYKPNNVSGKIVFFHGLNREESKGTRFIREAMEKLREKYPDDVEIIIDGHMPFNEYIKVIEKTNVVVDQCLTYGYGINTCISLAQGKVVMAPCRGETLDSFGINQSPVINIEPDATQIFSQMEYLVKNKDRITHIGVESRRYVEYLHDYKKVARQYLYAWKSTCRI